MYAANESYEHVARRSYWKPGQSASAIKHDRLKPSTSLVLRPTRIASDSLMASVQCV